jgi:hypothetical protein
MKTKIVYVVVSNDNDIYLEQTLLSIYSVKFYNPDAEIILLVDNFTNDTIKGKRAKILDYISSKVVVEIKGKYTNQQRSRIIKTSVREYIEGDFLFIDSDTIITSSLAEVDFLNCDIGAVNDCHVSLKQNPRQYDNLAKKVKKMKWEIDINKESNYFNSGVLYVKDNLKSKQFYKDWNKYWYKGMYKGINLDQPALAMSNVLNNHIINELSGVWNCQLRRGLKYLEHSKIIHYLCTDKPRKSQLALTEFMNINLFLKIKETGNIDDETIQILKNPKSSFVEYTNIIAGEDVFMWESTTIGLLRYIYYNYNSVFKCFEFISKCIRRIVGNP